MTPLDVRELHASPLARVADVACGAPCSPRGEPEWNGEPELIVPRRGVFAVHRRTGVTVADATTAVLLEADEEYRVSHPGRHGDACTVLRFTRATLEEAVGAPRRPAAPLRPATQRRAALLTLAGTSSPATCGPRSGPPGAAPPRRASHWPWRS